MESGENVRAEEAKRLTSQIQESEELAELEEMLKKNYVEWKQNGITYKVRKPTYSEQQELRNAKVKRHNELRIDPNRKYEKQLIMEYEKKGISISKMVEKQLEINSKIEELELQLAKLGNDKEADNKAITMLKVEIYNLMTERNSLSLEKMELLSESIENELLIFISSYTCALVLEKRESGDNWVRVFNSYEDFMNSEDDALLNKASYYLSCIIFRPNA